MTELTSDERVFFSLVAEVIFTNPFTDDWSRRERELAGDPHVSTETDKNRMILDRVGHYIRRLEETRRDDLKRLGPDDAALIRGVFLFEAFHRVYPRFDSLIVEQIAAGDEPLPVPFASENLALLRQRGFSAEEARRFFAIFFQLRRAFYFVDRGLVGRSPCMKQLRRRLWQNVFTHDIRWYDRHLCQRMEDFSTLILGETGTGKGAAAAAIGRSGFIPFDERKGRFTESFTRSFIALNLSQFSESLIESELFGHRKGAFTGAVEAHEGILSRGSPHGAIFLDEIGEVTQPIQIKLLQVLQERAFTPVGSHEKRRFQGRIIAATNQPLAHLRQGGLFRDDFYYRLCSDVIVVPPLRQRIEEDPSEMADLLALATRRIVGDESPDLADMVREAIRSSTGPTYAWPGNVRELEQSVRRILLTREYKPDQPAVLPDLLARMQEGLAHGTLSADALLAGYCALLHARHGTYEEVARRTRLDRRTAKAYVTRHSSPGQPVSPPGASTPTDASATPA